jgi:hypothetical protein
MNVTPLSPASRASLICFWLGLHFHWAREWRRPPCSLRREQRVCLSKHRVTTRFLMQIRRNRASVSSSSPLKIFEADHVNLTQLLFFSVVWHELGTQDVREDEDENERRKPPLARTHASVLWHHAYPRCSCMLLRTDLSGTVFCVPTSAAAVDAVGVASKTRMLFQPNRFIFCSPCRTDVRP